MNCVSGGAGARDSVMVTFAEAMLATSMTR